MSQGSKYLVDETSSNVFKSNKALFIFIGVLILASAIAVAVAVPLTINQITVETALQRANAILDEVPIIDGHNDWPWQMRKHLKNSINGLDLHDDFTQKYNPSHTDIPRLRAGKVGAQFWACFVHCNTTHKDAVRQGLEQIDIIKRFTKDYPDTFQFALTAADIEEAWKNKKIASLIGVEGGHMIDSSLAALRMYFELGTRYMTLTHSCDLPWADAWNGKLSIGGLTDFGKRIIGEMNRLGMLVDLSHVSDGVMNDVLNITKAPIIYSHSSARAICDHKRNVPDYILQKVKDNNGIVMVNFYNDYVTCSPNANLSNVADHFDYIKNLIGVDYIGMGGDYDGVTRVPVGLEDVSTYPNLIAELLKRGWTDEEAKKISGLNILRVMKDVEEVARQLQQTTNADESWIPESAVANISCRTRFYS